MLLLFMQNVNARIEVQDEDFLGKYDLIEQVNISSSSFVYWYDPEINMT